MNKPEPKDGGFALVLAIWTLLLLSALATVFALSMRTHTQATANAVSSARAAAYADAGVAIAVAALFDWNRGETGWRRIVRFDGTPFGCMIAEDVSLAISIQDEAGRVDINFADERLIAALFRGAGVPNNELQSYVDRLVDFRDRDNLQRPQGAEEAEYRNAGLKYGPKNREFSSIDELEQVLGFPAELMKAVRPNITVHSRLTGVDFEIAPLPIIRAVVAGQGVDAAAQSPRLASQLRSGANAMAPHLRVRSARTIYSVLVLAALKHGTKYVRETVVELTNRPHQPYQFRVWQRGDMAMWPILRDDAQPLRSGVLNVDCILGGKP